MKDNGLTAWETNAEFWDQQMGDHSNDFHCEIVRPTVEQFLKVNANDLVLDIACGNGNFSERMAHAGATVVAFDYSAKMIELAKKRRERVLNQVDFHVCDASNYDQLLSLKQESPFTKAVANMAIMDISEIAPLFKAVSEMLEPGGLFVFATHHPCFTYPNEDYFEQQIEPGFAFEDQLVLHNYYHRSISDILKIAFQNGFVMSDFNEIPFPGKCIPIIMTVCLQKQS